METCEKKVQDIVEKKLGITVEIDFDRCRRTGKFKRNQSKPRTIVCRLLRFKDKEKNLQNSKKLKDTGIFIYEDFCKTTMVIWREIILSFGCFVFFDARRYKMNRNKQNKISYSPQNFEFLKCSLLDDNNDISLGNSCDPDLNLFSENNKNFDTT